LVNSGVSIGEASMRVAIAESCRIFSGLIIIVWFSREWSSPALCRSPDLQVNVSSLLLVVLGQETILKLNCDRNWD
jgi:hypothetical protein